MEGVENESLIFLLRTWVWPEDRDLLCFAGLGFNSPIVAPFDYLGLPLAVFWGWIVSDDPPDAVVTAGILLILRSGLFVVFRERQKMRRELALQETHRRF